MLKRITECDAIKHAHVGQHVHHNKEATAPTGTSLETSTRGQDSSRRAGVLDNAIEKEAGKNRGDAGRARKSARESRAQSKGSAKSTADAERRQNGPQGEKITEERIQAY